MLLYYHLLIAQINQNITYTKLEQIFISINTYILLCVFTSFNLASAAGGSSPTRPRFDRRARLEMVLLHRSSPGIGLVDCSSRRRPASR